MLLLKRWVFSNSMCRESFGELVFMRVEESENRFINSQWMRLQNAIEPANQRWFLATNMV